MGLAAVISLILDFLLEEKYPFENSLFTIVGYTPPQKAWWPDFNGWNEVRPQQLEMYPEALINIKERFAFLKCVQLNWTNVPIPISFQQWKIWPTFCSILILLEGGKWQHSHYINDMRKQLTSLWYLAHSTDGNDLIQSKEETSEILHSITFPGQRQRGSLYIPEEKKTYFLKLPCTGNFITTEFQSPLVFLNKYYWKISLLFMVILPSIQGRTLPSLRVNRTEVDMALPRLWPYEITGITPSVPLRIEFFWKKLGRIDKDRLPQDVVVKMWFRKTLL